MRLLRLAKSVLPPLPSFLRRFLPESGPDGLDPSIYGYILHYSLREQIYLVIVTLLYFPFVYRVVGPDVMGQNRSYLHGVDACRRSQRRRIQQCQMDLNTDS